ncbi:hypothetical protein PMG11_11349 [Penicillium brasilianum]|uniref:PLAT domain-containing protein n=1 Tax=Penicillium brasilianum TaxID=104259 RepID=A0A0F7U1K9_PENBI|nr:hypothetical protein PMG11_11349 [Penicillium brasilianum]
MTLAHNLTLRHLNAIYLQATGVQNSQDIQDFLFFCKTWVDELHAHHAGEDEILFPMLDTFTGTKGIMSKSEEQHNAFLDGVDEFSQYIQRVTVREYDGTELRRIIQGFANPLLLHLRDEPIQLLQIGEKFGGARLKSVWDKFESTLIKEGMSKWDKHIILPLALGTNDHDFEGGAHAKWPPFPFFLPFLIRVYFGKRHSGAWRFFPCWNSKKRNLEFVGEGWQDYEKAK